MTKNRLSGVQQREVWNNDSINASRRETLLELWSDTDIVKDLHSSVHEAFRLPKLSDQTDISDEPEEVVGEEKEPKRPDIVLTVLPDRLRLAIDELDKWKNGQKLPQTLAQDLRELIYDLLRDYLPFDDEFLLAGPLKANLWKAANINFKNQFTQARRQTILLELPLPSHSLTDTTIALQAILMFKHFQSWNVKEFKDSQTYFLVLSRLLPDWSQYVLTQLKEIPTSTGHSWDPVPTGIEVLAVSAMMSGESKVKRISTTIMDPLFRKPSRPHAHRSTAWRKMQEQLNLKYDDVRNSVINRIPCTKGSSSDIKIVDAFQVMKVIQSLDADLILKYSPPTEPIRGFESVISIHNLLQRDLKSVIEEEILQHSNWAERVERLIGSDTVSVISTMNMAITRASETASLSGGNRADLESSLASFRKTKPAMLVEHIRKLNSYTSDAKLERLGQLNIGNIEVIDNFMKLTSSFLEHSTIRVDRQLNEIEITPDGQQLDGLKSDILESFNRLILLVSPKKEGVRNVSKTSQ